MKKGDILEGKVLKTEFPNKGILYIEEKKVVVKNALEGQTIRFSVSKKRKDRVEGRLLEVLAPRLWRLHHRTASVSISVSAAAAPTRRFLMRNSWL